MTTFKSTLLRRRESSPTTTSGFLQTFEGHGTVGLGGKARSEQFIMDENDTLPRGKVHIRERWGGVLPDPPEQEIA